MWDEEDMDAASRRKFAWLAGIVAAAAALAGRLVLVLAPGRTCC